MLCATAPELARPTSLLELECQLLPTLPSLYLSKAAEQHGSELLLWKLFDVWTVPLKAVESRLCITFNLQIPEICM